jgi:alanine racemase
MVRPTYAEISLDAIGHNVRSLASAVSPSKVCTVLKADAYGHGDVPVAGVALDAGATLLAVALVEEGARLREAGIESPIIVLSEPGIDDAGDIARWGLEPTVYTVGFAEALAATRSPMRAHVKVDTGMHRVGARPADVDTVVDAVRRSGNVDLASLWTHFAVADEDPEYTRLQIERFDEVAARHDVPATHLANTAGALLFPEARRDLCRIGLGTYGLHPCEETRAMIDLRPAMRVVSHVSHVQRLPGGERPSYGRVKALSRESTVATVPIGYADGLWRSLTKSGQAIIAGRRFPLAGTVTMDQIVVDVGDEDVSVGEEVVLLGSSGGKEVTADDWARALGTISYEVVCSIGPRVPRKYT